MAKYSKILTLLATIIAYLAKGTNSARDPDMSYVPLPESTSPGGKCMDGTMAGYYIREGTDPSLFVIFLKGGGACITKEECDARINSIVGTSKNWKVDKVGDGFLSSNCDENPDFCKATAVHVPYCTSDTHRGTNDEPSELSWGYYFDGHLNFIAIIEKLIAENGLGDATNVLLTGGSAGAIGALFNVDWLADRLPGATVKASPSAGWFHPNALDDDLPEPHYPSDYYHFSRGENGNSVYNLIEAGGAPVDVWKATESMSPDCLAAFSDDEWWRCLSARWAYKFVKSSIYLIHSQYDSNQIFSDNAPHIPANDTELDTVKRYVQMWGNATRESLENTIAIDDVAFPKPHVDGVFSASCILHGGLNRITINGYYPNQLIHDWFFQNGKYDVENYKLIESCDPLEGNEGYVIPCNTAAACAYKPNTGGGGGGSSGGGSGREKMERCAERLYMEGCLESFRSRQDCLTCAGSNSDPLMEAGCTTNIVRIICGYAEENDIYDEFDGRTIEITADDLDNMDNDEASGASPRHPTALRSILMLEISSLLFISSLLLHQ